MQYRARAICLCFEKNILSFLWSLHSVHFGLLRTNKTVPSKKLSTVRGLLHADRIFSNEEVVKIIFIKGNENLKENELIGNQSFMWWNAIEIVLTVRPTTSECHMPWTVNWVVDMFLNNTELNSQIFWGKDQLATSHDTLRKHPTFCDSTTGFPVKCLRN